MSARPKRKKLIDKATSWSQEAKDSFLAVWNTLAEIEIPQHDISSMQMDQFQAEVERPMTRKEKIRAVLGGLAFLALYILTNSIAPVAWTPNGTLPL